MKTNDKLMTMLLIAGMLAFGFVVVADSEDSDAEGIATYDALKEALEASGTAEVNVTGGFDITAQITVVGTKTLNLGAALTFSGSSSTPALYNTGTLTITGSGSITGSTGAARAAIINGVDATCTISGGTFSSASWYTIRNYGTMTIDGGTVQGVEENDSSMITNGWAGSSDAVVGSYQSGKANLTVNSGATFLGNGGNKSCSILKNDDGGVAIINGGTFNGTANNQTSNAAIVMNWHDMTINDGTFIGMYIANGYCDANKDIGELKIKGGTFTTSSTSGPFGNNDGSTSGEGSLVVEGGTFNTSATEWGTRTYTSEVKGGVFSSAPDADFLASGYSTFVSDGKYIVGKNCTVTFDANGGSYGSNTTTTKTIVAGDVYGTLPTPTHDDDYTLTGWFTENLEGTEITSTSVVGSDITVYAHWVKTSEEGTTTESTEETTNSEGQSVVTTTKVTVYSDGSAETTVSAVTTISDTQTQTVYTGYYVDSSGDVTESTVTTTVTTGSDSTTITETGSISSTGSSTVTTTAEATITSTAAAISLGTTGTVEVVVSDAIATAIAAAASSSSSEIAIAIDADVPMITLPSALLSNDDISSVTVSVNTGSNDATVTIPASALASATLSEAVSISVTSSTATASASKLGASTATNSFDLTLIGSSTTKFDDNVTVSYAVELPMGAIRVKAYCIDEDKSYSALYSDGVATFSVPHFSSWTVTYILPTVVDDDEDNWYWNNVVNKQSSSSEGTTVGDNSEEEIAVIIAAAAVAGAMLACVFFAFRKS